MFSRISLLVMWALIALPVLACGESGHRLPPFLRARRFLPSRPVTASPTILPLPDWQAELRPLEPDAVCEVLTRKDLAPYEPIYASTQRADEFIESGWTHRDRPTFRLEPPIDWEHLISVDRSWNFALNEWRPVNSVLAAHTQSSEPRYLTFSVALADDWIEKTHTRPLRLTQGWKILAGTTWLLVCECIVLLTCWMQPVGIRL